MYHHNTLFIKRQSVYLIKNCLLKRFFFYDDCKKKSVGAGGFVNRNAGEIDELTIHSFGRVLP